MPILNRELLEELEELLSDSFTNINDLVAFLQEKEVDKKSGLNFNDEVPPNDIFRIQKSTYFSTLNRQNSMEYFLIPFFEDFKNLHKVQDFKVKIDKLPKTETVGIDKPITSYISTPKPNYNLNDFNCHFLANNRKIFLNREPLKERLYELIIKSNENNHIFLNGSSGSGLSYAFNYFRDISNLTNTFKLVQINLNDIFKRVKGQITLAHIASEFRVQTPNFGLSYKLSEDERFKYEEFIIYLNAFLENTDKKFLFFIDQFNNPYSEDVSDFMCEFVKNIFNKYYPKHYVVLAGFNNMEKMQEDIIDSAINIKFDSFKTIDIDNFIKHLYEVLVTENHDIEFTADELLTELKTNAPFYKQELFYSGASPNVKTIGENVNIWLKQFKEQIG